MKILSSLIIGTVLLVLGSLVFDVEINPLVLDESLPEWANVFITLFLSALTSSVVGALELLPALAIIGFGTLFFWLILWMLNLLWDVLS